MTPLHLPAEHPQQQPAPDRDASSPPEQQPDPDRDASSQAEQRSLAEAEELARLIEKFQGSILPKIQIQIAGLDQQEVKNEAVVELRRELQVMQFKPRQLHSSITAINFELRLSMFKMKWRPHFYVCSL